MPTARDRRTTPLEVAPTLRPTDLRSEAEEPLLAIRFRPTDRVSVGVATDVAASALMTLLVAVRIPTPALVAASLRPTILDSKPTPVEAMARVRPMERVIRADSTDVAERDLSNMREVVRAVAPTLLAIRLRLTTLFNVGEPVAVANIVFMTLFVAAMVAVLPLVANSLLFAV